MPASKDGTPPDEIQELSASERDSNLSSAKSDAEWQAEQGVDSAKKRTSAHEDKGWRALKPF